MAHAYTIIPAKPAFGNYAKHLSYADVIANKRANHIYYGCQQTNSIKSQSDLIAIRKITEATCENGCNILPFNKSNMQINLITELYLNNILILELNTNPNQPAKINPQLTPIYSYYTIDPNNKLSGNTPCAIQKYVNYMILNTNAFVDSGCPDETNFTAECYCEP